jgi:2-polyprenyl-3-methyl-5-hydroxy-6-metoxy-1,4-benzoquinol methylase
MAVFLRRLGSRRRRDEIMDRPDLERARHFQALTALERLNLWSGSARILWPPIYHLAKETSSRRLTVLDIASGAGDIPIRLFRRAARAGLSLQIEGGDISPRAVAYAQERAARAKVNIHFFPIDALAADIPGSYDVVTCSLFLHHLEDGQVVRLLRTLAPVARHLLLVSDLNRSCTGFVAAYLATRLLCWSDVVRTDGPWSVEAAFTVDEVTMLAERAKLVGATVAKRWPFRLLLTWRRPG